MTQLQPPTTARSDDSMTQTSHPARSHNPLASIAVPQLLVEQNTALVPQCPWTQPGQYSCSICEILYTLSKSLEIWPFTLL